MPLAPLGFNLLEVSPHVSPFSFRSCVPHAVGRVLAPRPSPRPKPPNQSLPRGFSAALPQRLTLGFRDFPSCESVRLLVVLPTVQGRSSSRFLTHELLHGVPLPGSPLGSTCAGTATTEIVAVSSLPNRELLRLATRTPREVCLAPHNLTRDASVRHGRPSLDEPGSACHASQPAPELPSAL